jgi:predicted lipid-binding transport protein (Tim44 family)
MEPNKDACTGCMVSTAPEGSADASSSFADPRPKSSFWRTVGGRALAGAKVGALLGALYGGFFGLLRVALIVAYAQTAEKTAALVAEFVAQVVAGAIILAVVGAIFRVVVPPRPRPTDANPEFPAQ